MRVEYVLLRQLTNCSVEKYASVTVPLCTGPVWQSIGSKSKGQGGCLLTIMYHYPICGDHPLVGRSYLLYACTNHSLALLFASRWHCQADRLIAGPNKNKKQREAQTPLLHTTTVKLMWGAMFAFRRT